MFDDLLTFFPTLLDEFYFIFVMATLWMFIEGFFLACKYTLTYDCAKFNLIYDN
jgi:hypothetical protein